MLDALQCMSGVVMPLVGVPPGQSKTVLGFERSIPKQVDKKSGVPEEEKEVWGSQGGDRGLEFSRRRKGQTLFFYIP